jgi:hypothetical protein
MGVTQAMGFRFSRPVVVRAAPSPLSPELLELFVVGNVTGVSLGGSPVTVGQHCGAHGRRRDRLFGFLLFVLAVVRCPFEGHGLLTVRVAHQTPESQQQQHGSRGEQRVLQCSLSHWRRLRGQLEQLDHVVGQFIDALNWK